MKLSNFITTVLVDVENGINNAARTTNRHTFLHTIGTSGNEGVEFDVAITAGGEVSGKIGAEVFSIGTKAEGKMKNEEVNRIKFRVMVGNYRGK